MTTPNITAPATVGAAEEPVSREREARGRLRGWDIPAVRRYLPLAVLLCGVILIYRGWLANGAITWGDWRFQPGARLQDYAGIPSLWDAATDTGSTNLFNGPLLPVLSVEALLTNLGIDPTLAMRLIWVFPGVLIGAFATYALAVSFFSSRVAGVFAGLFMVSNTYAALIATGGQFTVSTGYWLTAAVVLFFYRGLRRPLLSRFLLTGLSVAVQVMYDLRSTYITFGMLLLLSLYYVLARRSVNGLLRAVVSIVVQFVAIGVVTVLVHAFWLLPMHYAQGGGAALPSGYNGVYWVHVLSYMQLSHAFALFHPFWYQDSASPNAGPVDPIFFLLPLAVFAVLLRKRLSFVDLFLLSTALLAIFLVKGSNAPAGTIYEWLFTHFPGFSLYRDPSKFYQPLALAYALLLGRAASSFPLRKQLGTAGRKGWFGPAAGVAALGVCLVVVLIQAVPVAANTQWGTLRPQTIPAGYIAVNRYIDRQSQFFRTIWIPSNSFGTFSARHPEFSLDDVGHMLGNRLPNPSDPKSWVRLPQAAAVLRALSIKYIVVGDDPANTPHAYRTNKANALRTIRSAFPSLHEMRMGDVHVFVNRSFLPAAFVPGAGNSAPPAYKLLQRVNASPSAGEQRVGKIGEFTSSCGNCLVVASQSRTKYEVIVRHASHRFLLVLNQSFDPNWVAYVEPSAAPQPFIWTWVHGSVASQYHLTVNGFANAWWINAPGTHRIVLEYWPQRLTDVGWVISWATILVCLAATAVPWTIRWLRRRRSSTTGRQRSVPTTAG